MISGRYFQRLYFRPGRVETVLESIGKNLEKVAYDWGPPDGKVDPDFPPAPSRSTIHDWIAAGFPAIKKNRSANVENSRFYQALALCGQLNVDPMVLFDLERNGFTTRFAILRKAMQLGMGAMGAHAPLFELFEPNDSWPSNALAKRFWGRCWSAYCFSNEEQFRSDDYALIKVRFSEPPEKIPRAIHIAYRRWESREQDTMWRFYGTVLNDQDKVELFNEGGVHRVMKRRPCCDLEFKTYFGGRKVEFRIVSLHGFDVELVFPFNDVGIIGFDW